MRPRNTATNADDAQHCEEVSHGAHGGGAVVNPMSTRLPRASTNCQWPVGPAVPKVSPVPKSKVGWTMALDLKGCRTLVTGASSGIGAGLAEALAERGAVVGICARRADRLSEVVERCMEHSPDSRMWVVNLADPDAVDKLAVDVLEAFGGIDLLVNNAGIPKRRHVTALDIDTVTAVMHVNYLSPMRLTLDLLPQMLARGSGTIVNISSVAATLSAPGEAAYDASKAALTAFSEAMAVDLWDAGVKVMVVYPGVIDTELFTLPDNDVPDLPVAAEPVSVAVDAILAGLEAGAAQVYVPEWFHGVAAAKAQDVGKFLEGTAAYLPRAEAEEAGAGRDGLSRRGRPT